MQYKSGVLRQEDCDCTAATQEDVLVNHVMTLIGYKADKNAAKGCSGYWLLKNSWGTEWGENGFMRLCISSDADDKIGTCNVLSFPHLPDVGMLPAELPRDVTEVDS